MSHAGLPLTETLAPTDEAGVVEALRRAFDRGNAVYPIGGGTSLALGAWPTRPGVGLELGRLTRVIDHAVDDLTITVEAGVTMASLEKVLAARRQRLPVDVPRADRATVGGAVATGAAGPWRYRFGSVRDYVIGLRAVDGTGEPFSAGGRVVKNAAGYNLCRLLCGSLGTLAVITQVTLMVRPVPESEALLVCDVPELDAAERTLAALVHTDALPVAIELLVGPAWQAEPTLPSPAVGAVGRLVVGLEGTAAEVAWMVDSLRGRLQQAGAAEPVLLPSGRIDAVRRRLVDFPVATPQTPLVVQITVLPSGVVPAAKRLTELAPEATLAIHAGDGVIRAKLARLPERIAEFLEKDLRPLAAAAGGVLNVLAHPREARLSPAAVWGPLGDGATLAESIRERFDPKHVLNPGRLAAEREGSRATAH